MSTSLSMPKRVACPSRNRLPERNRKYQLTSNLPSILQLSRQPPHDGLVQSRDAIGLQCFDNAVEDQTDSHGGDEKSDNPSYRIDTHGT